MATLLVDGDNLLTRGYEGMKNYFFKGKHIGGIFHFVNTLRRLLETHKLDKIVVFWDGEDGSAQRKAFYPEYKENRTNKGKSEEEIDSYNYQRHRIKLYLEEIFVRQGEYELCETDDCIAYYSQKSNEDIIIYSSDGDLVQLVSENVKIYNPSHQKVYGPNDIFKYKNFELPIENVIILKTVCGDNSDNIKGIKNVGLKRLFSVYPELLTTPITIEQLIQKGSLLKEQSEKKNWVLENILMGVTKDGVLGKGFFELNSRLISLEKPLLTDEAEKEIELLINETIDPEGRSYKNGMKLMMEDGFHLLLPKTDMAWVHFLNPFLKLTRKEKNKKRIIKITKNE